MASSIKSFRFPKRFSLNPISSPKQSFANRKFSSLLQQKYTKQQNSNYKNVYNKPLFTLPKFRAVSTSSIMTSSNGTSSLFLALLGLFGFGFLSNEASAESDLNSTEERLYDQVMEALSDGDYAKARGLVADRLEEKPTCRAGLYIKGFLLMQQGRYQEALGSFDAVIVLSPDWADTYSKRAECLIALGRLQDALRTLNYVINRFPSWHEPKYLKVETLLRLRKGEAAERLLDDLLQSGSWTQQGLYLKAALSFANSDYARSLLYADEAFHLNNNFVDAMVLKGLSLDAMQYHEPAVECFSKALQTAENHDTATLVTRPQAIGQVLNNLVGLMTTLNQEEKAIHCRQKLTEHWLAMVATRDQ